MFSSYQKHSIGELEGIDKNLKEALEKIGISATEDLLIFPLKYLNILLQQVDKFPLDKLSEYLSIAELLQISQLTEKYAKKLFDAKIISLSGLAFPDPKTLTDMFGAEIDLSTATSWQKQALAINYTGKISGQITYKDKPIANAIIYCGKETAISDKDGKFWLPVVVYGKNTVIVRADGYKRFISKITVMPEKVIVRKFSLRPMTGKTEIIDEAKGQAIRKFSIDDKLVFKDIPLSELPDGTPLQFREHYKNGEGRFLNVFRRRNGNLIETDRIKVAKNLVNKNAIPGDIFYWEKGLLRKGNETLFDLRKKMAIGKFGKHFQLVSRN